MRFGFLYPRSLLLAVLLCCPPSLVFAEIWTIELDGTGDFLTIQEAVDAASDGDTIAIGAGRFSRAVGGMWVGIVETEKNLIFVGSEAGETIIGPEDPASISDSAIGIRMHAGGIVRRITFENCNLAGIMHVEHLTVEDCRFVHHGDPEAYPRRAIYNPWPGAGGGGYARDCRFEHLGNAFSAGWGDSHWEIVHCQFVDCSSGIFTCESTSSLDISNSSFEDCGSGIGIHLDATGSIRDCELANSRLTFYGPSVVTIQGTQVECRSDEPAVLLRAIDSATITDCIFRNDTGPTIEAERVGGIITSSHIVSGHGTWSVYCPPANPTGVLLDMSGNWWGTTDVAVVADSIWDCHDDAEAAHCVAFEPMADGPVRVEAHTWGSVKALFR